MEPSHKQENETGAAILLYMSISSLVLPFGLYKEVDAYKTGKRSNHSLWERILFDNTSRNRILESYFPILVPTMKSTLHRAHRTLSIGNDILLLPMFLLLVYELREQSLSIINESWGDWLMTASFASEWLLGLFLAQNKWRYFRKPANIFDLLSCFPFGALTKSVRIARFMRVFKVVRFVTRANRYRGPADKFIRLLALVGATVFAGAYSIEIVEPTMLIAQPGGTPKFTTGLWWAWVTISTVGYGDVTPSTDAGRLVATPLIMVGVGVCGYISAFMMQLMSHQDDSDHPTKEDVLRLEKKLDRLAQKLNIEDWNDINSDEQSH